jgi:hypothetical protein
MEKYGRARQAMYDNVIRRMRIAGFISKATNTHSEYVMRVAFPRRYWLHERAPLLRYTYTACHVFHVCEDGRIIPQRRQQMLLVCLVSHQRAVSLPEYVERECRICDSGGCRSTEYVLQLFRFLFWPASCWGPVLLPSVQKWLL